MHEWGLVTEAVAQVERHVDGRGCESVTLVLGPGADETTVRTAWASATEAGPLGPAELRVEHQADLLRCLSCGHQYRGRSPDPCDACAGDGLVTDSVEDLTVAGWVLARAPTEEVRPCV